MVFNKLQQLAYEKMLEGKNIFLTGGGGVGKSYVIKKFIKQVEDKKNIVICAPTGIAASAIDGVTMHRLFKIPLGIVLGLVPDRNEIIEAADIIIIDEISMCRFDIFNFISQAILNAENITKRKIQLVVIGDFYQLPPVIAEIEKDFFKRDEGYAFLSEYWDKFNFQNFILTESERQKGDDKLIEQLNKARVGDYTCIKFFNLNCSRVKDQNAITICSTNIVVDKINYSKLMELRGNLKTFQGIKQGDVDDNDLATNTSLEFKIGARVMTLINDNSGAYQNGTLGTIKKMTNKTITVKMDRGNLVEIEAYKWSIYKYILESDPYNVKIKTLKKIIIGTFTQIPLKLAYALTVHKAQGQTYDSINLDPYCLLNGQLYTALSRVKSIEGLHLIYDIKAVWLMTSATVTKFYSSIKV